MAKQCNAQMAYQNRLPYYLHREKILKKKEGNFIKLITQHERDKLEKHGYLKGEKKVYISSVNKNGRAKRYYTLDELADIAKTLKDEKN